MRIIGFKDKDCIKAQTEAKILKSVDKTNYIE